MKRISTLLFVFLFFFMCEVNAQKTGSSLKTIEPTNTNTAPKPIDEQEILKQISQIDSHLSAIETKRNYVLSDPAEKALAIEQGWFEDMKKIEKSLLKKKNELKRLIDN